MVWYSHLFQNCPQFIVIHTLKGFGRVNKAEIDVFLELSCFFHDPADVSNLISGSSAFSNTSDCGSDHEILITKLRLKLKKVGKTTRPFKYDLNQIPYDYTVEVQIDKGLDLIDRVPDELWTEVRDIVQEQESRPSPRKRNAKRQNGCLRRPYK